MKALELISIHRQLLGLMVDNGLKAKDVRHLPMYREYQRMAGEGHKMTYIVAFLADEYGVSESTVYRVIYRLQKEVTV